MHAHDLASIASAARDLPTHDSGHASFFEPEPCSQSNLTAGQTPEQSAHASAVCGGGCWSAPDIHRRPLAGEACTRAVGSDAEAASVAVMRATPANDGGKRGRDSGCATTELSAQSRASLSGGKHMRSALPRRGGKQSTPTAMETDADDVEMDVDGNAATPCGDLNQSARHPAGGGTGSTA
eukprot:2917249-Pleurochrysis_carterae.AAC.1